MVVSVALSVSVSTDRCALAVVTCVTVCDGRCRFDACAVRWGVVVFCTLCGALCDCV